MTTKTVRLLGITPKTNVIKYVRLVRQFTGLGLYRAKSVVDDSITVGPREVAIIEGEAADFAVLATDLGARVEIVEDAYSD